MNPDNVIIINCIMVADPAPIDISLTDDTVKIEFTEVPAVIDATYNGQSVVDEHRVAIIPIPTKADIGLENVDNTSDTDKPVSGPQQIALNGKADLIDGKVPASQLPSYVDDVIEAYVISGATPLTAGWLSLTEGGQPLTPEKGKIYVILSSGAYLNHTYRWSGSAYVEISGGAFLTDIILGASSGSQYYDRRIYKSVNGGASVLIGSIVRYYHSIAQTPTEDDKAAVCSRYGISTEINADRARITALENLLNGEY